MPERRKSRSRASDHAGWFVQHLWIARHGDPGSFPFTLPVVRHLTGIGGLERGPGVTFLIGDNDTGKSTLVEALAVACGSTLRAARGPFVSRRAPPSLPLGSMWCCAGAR